MGQPAHRFDRLPGQWTGVDAGRHLAAIRPGAGVDEQPATVVRRRAGDEQRQRALVGWCAVDLDSHDVALHEVRQRAEDGRCPAAQPPRASLGVTPRDQRIPAGAREERQAPVDGDQVGRARLAACQEAGQRGGVTRQSEQMGGRVAEAGGNVTERHVAAGSRVKRHAQGPVSPRHHHRLIPAEALVQEGAQLLGNPRGGHVQVRIERPTGERNRALHPRAVRRAGALVDEDRRRSFALTHVNAAEWWR